MDSAVSLVCSRCGEQSPPGEDPRCRRHDEVLELAIDEDAVRRQFDPDTERRRDIWRYEPLFPVGKGVPVTLGEGWTPLISAPSMGERLGVDLSLKKEGANPTGSTKDRGSSVLATHALDRGHDGIACASTGNAAASIAAYAARAGLDCRLFVPGTLPEAKAVQAQVAGAGVTTVEGDYGDACDRCRTMAADPAWIDRSAGTTPFVPAGASTLGYELAEQVQRVPEWVVVPMGNGGTLAAAWQGWQRFTSLEFVDSVPRFLGVQSERVSPIHDAYHGSSGHPQGENEVQSEVPTCADSIAVAQPRGGRDARDAIEESGGAIVTVPDEAIRSAITTLGRHEGVFAEPASAATVAGIETARDRGTIDRGDRVIAVVTGTGLKDVDTAKRLRDDR